MQRKSSRRLTSALLLAAGALVVAACGEQYPNSTFTHLTEFNTAIDGLWNRLLFLGTIVFVFVEALLLYTIIKFRRREGAPDPKQTHGNSTLEITWTIIPALILVLIAVPTVRTIWETEAKAKDGSLQVQVIGHQWWWEFRYPQYGVVTANELYLPAGRTVNFQLNSRDVIHSFWTPQLGGKRDVVTNRTNYIWYTPDASLTSNVFNGFCAEYCGSSHANMRFHVYTVSTSDFESWAKHQAEPAAMSPAPAAAAAGAPGGAGDKVAAAASKVAGALAPKPAGAQAAQAAAATVPASDGYVFPLDKIPAHALPQTPLPDGDREVKFDDSLLPQGDAAKGHDLVTNIANMGIAPCLTCHVIRGEGAAMGLKDDLARGPNLTHFAERHTFAGGIYRSDPTMLARWVKNAEHMKPGSIMTTLGNGEYAPSMKSKRTSGLDDRQVADIVAYLMSLK